VALFFLYSCPSPYVDYYHHWRTPQSLEMDAPEP
jgi:hypothetical protein